jgi:bla regulator protein BlaR1
MILYLVESAICMVLLLGMYKLLYEKEKMFVFNRIYLLFSLAVSIVLPLVDIPLVHFSRSSIPQLISADRIPMYSELPSSLVTIDIHPQAVDKDLFLHHFLWLIYLIGLAILAIRFYSNLACLFTMRKQNERVAYEDAELVLLPRAILPFSFSSLIFVAKKDYEQGLEPELLAHEIAHVRQRHSLDLIFVELLSIVFWFNPILRLYKRAIQANHEFLADEAVNQRFQNVPAYQNLLLEKCGITQSLHLNNHFKQSINKLRLVMMYKQTAPIKAALKKLLLLPVLGALALTFSTHSVAQEEKKAEEKPPVSTQQVLATDPVTAYMALVDEGRMANKKSIDVRKLDKKLLREYYRQMTEEQKQRVPWLPFLELRLPDKKSPTAEQFSTWTDPATFGIWLNDTRIPNEKLKEYQADDIVLYYQSRLEKNARNYGKHIYQLDIYTEDGYEKVVAQIKESFNDE